MKRTLARLAAGLVMLPAALLATGGTASAQTVPGCYGVLLVFCDPTVSAEVPYELDRRTILVPVCVGSCTYVPVTYPVPHSTGGDVEACATWETQWGSQSGTCV